MKNSNVICVFLLLFTVVCNAQTGSLQFNIVDERTNEKVKDVDIVDVNNNTTYTFTNEETIQIIDLKVGVYSFNIENINYESKMIFEIEVTSDVSKQINVELTPISIKEGDVTQIGNVVLTRKTFSKTDESPLSLRNLTSQEITRNPGSNRDISKVIQSLPGVTTTASFRNDLLIRGGGPNENRFFIDGIETPVINHFATQGASGGPKGMINVDFIKDVDFYSSAFPANRGNALSSVFDFTYKSPTTDKIHLKAVVGLDDISLMAEGTLLENKSLEYLVSVRTSNLKPLFKILGLPFVPKYNDFQTKIQKKFKNGDKLYFLALAAYDDMQYNFDAEQTDQNLLILDALPLNTQWNYTTGVGYIKNQKNGKWEFIASRNYLNNKAEKYYKNIEDPNNRIIDYQSSELDNRLRIDRKFFVDKFQFNTGIGYNYSTYTNDSNYKYVTQDETFNEAYSTDLSFSSYYIYARASSKFFNNKLRVSAGVRADASSYSKELSQIIEQVSPRLALSYQFSPRWYFNFATGIYYQLPHYTAMGYKDNTGVLINKDQLDYIKNTHFAGGVEYNSKKNFKITLEGFYKKYNQYPVSTRTNVSLANIGGDFGVVGIEPIISNGLGRTYGIEFLAQQRSSKDIYGILSYTLSWSEFSDKDGNYKPSSWDSRHILSLTTGKKFNNNWDLGFRFRLQSPLPVTPYDLERSAFKNVWDLNNSAVYATNSLNTERGQVANQLDIRVEKKWYYKKWAFSVYLDVINVYGGSTGESRKIVTLVRDENGNGIIENPEAPAQLQRYKLNVSNPDKSKPLPYLGLIIEF